MAVTPIRERLAPDIFRLPVERIRDGYYSDAYFNHTKTLLEEDGRPADVLMQVFQKNASVLGGIDEAVAVLKLCSGTRDGLPRLPGPAHAGHAKRPAGRRGGERQADLLLPRTP